MLNLIPRFIHDKYIQEKFSGEFSAITMFVDIAGFTSITEQLMQYGKEGAETLSELINQTYTPLINSIYDFGGFISTFAGDSFTAIFEGADFTTAYHCALRVQRSLMLNEGVHKTEMGDFTISARVGLSCGEISWYIPGKDSNNTFYFKGDSILESSRITDSGLEGDICLHPELVMKYVDDNGVLRIEPYRPPHKPGISRVKKTVVSDFFPPQAISHKLTGEFRDVVSVFINFEDIEDYDQLNRLIGEIITSTGDYGGYFNGMFYDDKGPHLLVLFGAPISYEDDVERAIEFALSVRDGCSEQLRMGLDYGTVYSGILGAVRRCTYTSLGDTVNTSSRLMENVDWGSIWVSGRIHDSLEGGYRMEDIGEVEIKGKQETVKVSELISSEGAGEMVFFEGEMVGREDELERCIEFCEPLTQDNFGGVLYIYGEAGIGKSRLLYELSKKMEPDITTSILQTDSVLKKSLNPFIHFFKRYFNQDERTNVEENISNFEVEWSKLIRQLQELDNERIETILNELERMKSFIGALLGLHWEDSLYEELDAKGRFENTIFAIKEFFKARSLLKPLIIGIEDIQWLDTDSQEVVKVLPRHMEDFPFMILGLARFRDDGTKPAFELDENIQTGEIILQSLSRESIINLVERLLGAIPNKLLLHFIKRRTGGNPFYVEQFCHYLSENDLLELRGDEYHLIKDEIEVPEGIRAIIVARLDRLSRELRELAQTASVLGREFEVAVLSQMLKGREIQPLLVEGEVQAIWNALSEIFYIFKHAILRDTVYDMQLRKRLRELHNLATEAIKAVHPDDPTHFADLAYHYEKAEDIEGAREYLQKAGDYAREEYRNDEALELYGRLLKYVEDDRYEISINEKLAKIFDLIGRWNDAESIYNEILNKANQIGDMSLVADVYRNSGNLKGHMGDYEDGAERINRALELYRISGNEEGVYKSLNILGEIYYSQGNYEKAMDMFNKALKMSKNYDDEEVVSGILGNMGLVYQDKGDLDGALEYFERQRTIASEIDDVRNMIRALGNIGNIHLMKSDYENAVGYYEICLENSTEIGDKRGISYALGNIALIHSFDGEYEEALELFEKQLFIAEEIGDITTIATSNLNIGTIFYNIGDYKEALKRFEIMIETSKKQGDLPGVSFVSCSIGNVYKKLGKFVKAEEYYDRAVELGRQLEFNYYLCDYLYQKADLYYTLGRLDESQELNEDALSLAEEVGRQDKVFQGKILSIKIKAKSDKDTAIQKLKNLTEDSSEDKSLAIIYYELSKMTDDDEFKRLAISINEKLYENTSDIIYKERIEELERNP